MRFKVLPRAVRDLIEIRAYIAPNDEQAADAVALRLKRALELIVARPDVGRPIPEQRLREWSVPGLPYVIPYRVRGDLVEILRFFHTSRQRPKRWVG